MIAEYLGHNILFLPVSDMVTEERGVAKVELEREEQKLRAVQRYIQ